MNHDDSKGFQLTFGRVRTFSPGASILVHKAHARVEHEFWGIMADLLSRQRGVVDSMMRESMNITTPRPFQLEVIACAVYGSLSESIRLLLVAKCGSGKSAAFCE